MDYIICFLIAIFATTIGSLTGVGGGIIIKPLMDVLHYYSVDNIGIISSITILSMTIVSIGKYLMSKKKLPYNKLIPLSFGSLCGGYTGQKLLLIIISFLDNEKLVTIIQNVILALLILFAYFYINNKDRFKSYNITGYLPSIISGFFLGICSAFLGIGGGPINVVFLMFLYSMNAKQAAISSLVIILFSQTSKLLTVALTSGFSIYNLSVVPVMVIAAISGGFIGSNLSNRFNDKTIEKAFSVVQLFVVFITVVNIIKNIL